MNFSVWLFLRLGEISVFERFGKVERDGIVEVACGER